MDGEFERKLSQHVRRLKDKLGKQRTRIEDVESVIGAERLPSTDHVPGSPVRKQSLTVPMVVEDRSGPVVIGYQAVTPDGNVFGIDINALDYPIVAVPPYGHRIPAIGETISVTYVNQFWNDKGEETGGWIANTGGPGVYPIRILGAIGPETEAMENDDGGVYEVTALVTEDTDASTMTHYNYYYAEFYERGLPAHKLVTPNSEFGNYVDTELSEEAGEPPYTLITSVRQLDIAVGHIVPAGTMAIAHGGSPGEYFMQVPIWLE